ncbi:hypothetical protein HK096_009108, partial [Nowakowskiella sp. JEL0078]
MKYQHSSEKALMRVQAVLKGCCLRRIKSSLLDGKPIIVIPPKEVSLIRQDFNESELEFYKAVEQRVQLKFNSYVKAGTVMNNYSHVLVLLLRLRQACLHPGLVSKDFQPETHVELDNDGFPTGKKVDPLDLLSEEITARLLQMDLKDVECPVCMDVMQDGCILVKCGHLFCRECISSHHTIAEERGKEALCPSCRSDFNLNVTLSLASFMKKHKPQEDYKTHESSSSKIMDPDLENSEPDGWVSSTKIEKLLEILENTRQADLFSQFTGMLKLLEAPLISRGFKFVKIIGSMTAEKRANSISELENDDETTVIL